MVAIRFDLETMPYLKMQEGGISRTKQRSLTNILYDLEFRGSLFLLCQSDWVCPIDSIIIPDSRDALILEWCSSHIKHILQWWQHSLGVYIPLLEFLHDRMMVDLKEHVVLKLFHSLLPLSLVAKNCLKL